MMRGGMKLTGVIRTKFIHGRLDIIKEGLGE